MTEAKRILLIEDDAPAARLVRRRLAAMYAVVEMAASGDETTAVEAMKALRALGGKS